MSSASLQNMSVSPRDGANQSLIMPKLQFRFRVMFYNLGYADSTAVILTRQVIDAKRPTLTFDEIKVPIYNSEVYLAGKGKWSDCMINIRDDSTSLASTAIANQLTKQMNFEQMSTAAAGKDYKFMTAVEVLDGGNGGTSTTVLEKWELYGCWLKIADYQTLKYDANETVNIALTIRFDNASLSTNSGGLLGIAGDTARTVSTLAVPG